MMPETIQTMAWAYQQISAGEDPWTALGNFTNAWYGYAKDMRAALVSEPLAEAEQVTEQTLRWGAFCAASVEFLCDRYGVRCPAWVYHPRYTLATPWWHTSHPHNTSMRERLMRETPEHLVRQSALSEQIRDERLGSGGTIQGDYRPGRSLALRPPERNQHPRSLKEGLRRSSSRAIAGRER